jgi:hypothetical protein
VKDPQLRSEDDPSILVEEQFLTDHHAIMLQGKTAGSSTDNIIIILQWEKHHISHLTEEQKVMLAEQKNKTAKPSCVSSLQPPVTHGTMCRSTFGSIRRLAWF